MNKTLPELHHYATCPDFGMKILEFYKGYYETVFIVLHPFMKTNEKFYTRFTPSTWPTKKEIIKNTRAISWEDFIGLSGIKNLADLDLGLRGIIGGLRKQYDDKVLEKRILDYCAENTIVRPQEGFLPEIIFNDLLQAIQKQGHAWIWTCDEFSLERKLIFIDDLITEDVIIPRGNYFTYNHEILLTTHWDSHFSLLCGPVKIVQNIVKQIKLEGFYCNENTEIEWSFNLKYTIP